MGRQTRSMGVVMDLVVQELDMKARGFKTIRKGLQHASGGVRAAGHFEASSHTVQVCHRRSHEP